MADYYPWVSQEVPEEQSPPDKLIDQFFIPTTTRKFSKSLFPIEGQSSHPFRNTGNSVQRELPDELFFPCQTFRYSCTRKAKLSAISTTKSNRQIQSLISRSGATHKSASAPQTKSICSENCKILTLFSPRPEFKSGGGNPTNNYKAPSSSRRINRRQEVAPVSTSVNDNFRHFEHVDCNGNVIGRNCGQLSSIQRGSTNQLASTNNQNSIKHADDTKVSNSLRFALKYTENDLTVVDDDASDASLAKKFKADDDSIERIQAALWHSNPPHSPQVPSILANNGRGTCDYYAAHCTCNQRCAGVKRKCPEPTYGYLAINGTGAPVRVTLASEFAERRRNCGREQQRCTPRYQKSFDPEPSNTAPTSLIIPPPPPFRTLGIPTTCPDKLQPIPPRCPQICGRNQQFIPNCSERCGACTYDPCYFQLNPPACSYCVPCPHKCQVKKPAKSKNAAEKPRAEVETIVAPKPRPRIAARETPNIPNIQVAVPSAVPSEPDFVSPPVEPIFIPEEYPGSPFSEESEVTPSPSLPSSRKSPEPEVEIVQEQTESEPETKRETLPEPEPKSEPEPEPEPEPESEPKSETGLEYEIESETELESDPEIEPDSEPNMAPNSDPEPEVEEAPESEPEIPPEPDPSKPTVEAATSPEPLAFPSPAPPRNSVHLKSPPPQSPSPVPSGSYISVPKTCPSRYTPQPELLLPPPCPYADEEPELECSVAPSIVIDCPIVTPRKKSKTVRTSTTPTCKPPPLPIIQVPQISACPPPPPKCPTVNTRPQTKIGQVSRSQIRSNSKPGDYCQSEKSLAFHSQDSREWSNFFQKSSCSRSTDVQRGLWENSSQKPSTCSRSTDVQRGLARNSCEKPSCARSTGVQHGLLSNTLEKPSCGRSHPQNASQNLSKKPSCGHSKDSKPLLPHRLRQKPSTCTSQDLQQPPLLPHRARKKPSPRRSLSQDLNQLPAPHRSQKKLSSCHTENTHTERPSTRSSEGFPVIKSKNKSLSPLAALPCAARRSESTEMNNNCESPCRCPSPLPPSPPYSRAVVTSMATSCGHCHHSRLFSPNRGDLTSPSRYKLFQPATNDDYCRNDSKTFSDVASAVDAQDEEELPCNCCDRRFTESARGLCCRCHSSDADSSSRKRSQPCCHCNSSSYLQQEERRRSSIQPSRAEPRFSQPTYLRSRDSPPPPNFSHNSCSTDSPVLLRRSSRRQFPSSSLWSQERADSYVPNPPSTSFLRSSVPNTVYPPTFNANTIQARSQAPTCAQHVIIPRDGSQFLGPNLTTTITSPSIRTVQCHPSQRTVAYLLQALPNMGASPGGMGSIISTVDPGIVNSSVVPSTFLPFNMQNCAPPADPGILAGCTPYMDPYPGGQVIPPFGFCCGPTALVFPPETTAQGPLAVIGNNSCCSNQGFPAATAHQSRRRRSRSGTNMRHVIRRQGRGCSKTQNYSDAKSNHHPCKSRCSSHK